MQTHNDLQIEHIPVIQAVNSSPQATCFIGIPCNASIGFGMRYVAVSPCPN